ncbi:hypothetical protein V1264_005034 [Littorina saxatilis]
MRELREEDLGSYVNFLRMDPQHFDHLLGLVGPSIHKQDTYCRDSISPGERLAVTLRFLASGDSYRSLSYLYRIGKSTLAEIIPATCLAICDVLKRPYMKVPNTQAEWRAVADKFDERWQFPNCIGAMDGKHVAIKAPRNSGSMFFNYKNFHSIVLLALVDADYKVIAYDLGVNGRNNDAGIFGNSELYHHLEENTLNVPPPRPLPGRQEESPFVLVGDEAFPLKTYLLKPYPGRDLTDERKIFNYRLSRARRISENVFGILVNRFGVLGQTMSLEPDKATLVTEACLMLHNYLRSENDHRYQQEVQRPVEGNWIGIARHPGNRAADAARNTRDQFCVYFNTNGQVPWQYNRF